jgi:hypothetical protein
MKKILPLGVTEPKESLKHGISTMRQLTRGRECKPVMKGNGSQKLLQHRDCWRDSD